MSIKISEYRTLKEQYSAAIAEIAELRKKLASETSTKDSWYSQMNSAHTELEQVHQILDSLSNPPPRKSKHEESWRQVELSLTARLASWLASR